MKICIITNIPAPYRVDFFNYLIDNSGYDITIIYSSQNEDNREWKIESKLIRNSIFLKSKTIKVKKKLDYKYIHLPIDIIKQLNIIKPDVVVGSEYNPTIIQAFLWCKFKKKKFVSWSDGTLNSEKNINKIQLLLRKVICKNANSLIASSTATKIAQMKYGAKEEKIFISLLTIDIDKYALANYKKVQNDIPRILYVGSLIKRKGVDLLFNALANINEDYILDIVGDGEEKVDLVKLAKELEIYNKINFRGYLQQEDLIKFYYESDIFILPTREDCYGLVLLEALSCGTLVIASKYADGAIDIIEDGGNGYIIDPFKVNEFSNVIFKLLHDKNLTNKIKNESKKKLKKFYFREVAKNFIITFK